jgi:sigma-E factor negative regulatory protein RseB
MRRTSLLFFLSSLLSGGAVAADADDWFAQMTDRAAQQSFRGTFIYERSGIFSSHRIWHLAQTPKVSRERLLQLDGQPLEVVLVNGQVSCATAGLIESMADIQQWSGRQLDVARLEKAYELKLLGNSRVAGRPAVALLLLPRDTYRYARELHLDSESGLPLKSLLLNEQGQLLERLQFTSLSLSRQISEQELQAVTDCKKMPESEKASEVASIWQALWMPPGFLQVGVMQRPGAVSGLPVQSLLFDDGLAKVTIFIEPLGAELADTAHGQIGPTVVLSRPFKTAEGAFMATVVGEIPLRTAERIALSVGVKDSQSLAQ